MNASSVPDTMQTFDEIYSETRTRMIGLLRRSEHTVAELAEGLGVSGNAVRGHLAALVNDGVVRETDVRRDGVGKPARVYGLTPAARERLSRAYAPVLSLLVGVLEERLGKDQTTELLREVGERIGSAAAAQGSPAERVAAARAAFEAVGAMVEVRRSKECLLLEGADCPLGTVVQDHPDACIVAATLLGVILGRPVVERCDRSGETPRCRFEADVSDADGATSPS